MPGPGIRNQVVQGTAESFEQDRVTVGIDPQQPCAATTVSQAQRIDLETENASTARNSDLEHRRGLVVKVASATKAAWPPLSVAPMVSDQSCVKDSTIKGSSSSQPALPSAMTLFRTSVGMSSITGFLTTPRA